jgi:hypothetical protein
MLLFLRMNCQNNSVWNTRRLVGMALPSVDHTGFRWLSCGNVAIAKKKPEPFEYYGSDCQIV